jgi:hypothetical protein
MTRSDGDLFRRDVPRFSAASVRAVAGPVAFQSSGRIDESFSAAFPKLSRLPGDADVTRQKRSAGLFASDHPAGRRGWLCEPPGDRRRPMAGRPLAGIGVAPGGRRVFIP